MRDFLSALLFGLILAVLILPEWAAYWVFEFQSALFELQFQAAEEAME